MLAFPKEDVKVKVKVKEGYFSGYDTNLIFSVRIGFDFLYFRTARCVFTSRPIRLSPFSRATLENPDINDRSMTV